MIKNHQEFFSSTLPTISAADEKLDAESKPIRALLCALIDRAVEDLRVTATYRSKQVNDAVAFDKSTARTFLDSRIYRGICRRLYLPSDKIRNAALFDNPTQSHA